MPKVFTQNMSATQRLTTTAMFGAVATLLMYLEFQLPFMPPFLKIDLSGVAILICSFLFGPAQAVLVTLIKDLIHLLSTETGGVGELADFIILSSYAVTASLIYNRKKDKKHALAGCVLATGVMAVFAVFANKFLLIPFYSKMMPIDAIIGACAAVNPMIGDINAYYIFGVLPFNLIKGVLLSAITVLCYKKLSLVFKSNQRPAGTPSYPDIDSGPKQA